jgi:succinate dehydrogenase / fumarate reductase flavoprotein subunit
VGTPSLAHLTPYTQALHEAGIDPARRAPRLLPEYRGKESLDRSLDIPL